MFSVLVLRTTQAWFFLPSSFQFAVTQPSERGVKLRVAFAVSLAVQDIQLLQAASIHSETAAFEALASVCDRWWHTSSWRDSECRRWKTTWKNVYVIREPFYTSGCRSLQSKFTRFTASSIPNTYTLSLWETQNCEGKVRIFTEADILGESHYKRNRIERAFTRL